jgi:hypothetical protein
MPKKQAAKKIGRPRIDDDINWTELKKLVSYQCTEVELAAFFDVSVRTLERRFQEKFGETFADFIAKKKPAGRAKVKKIQFALAEQGSAAAAIWLGKNLLGQTDKPADQEILEAMSSSGLTRDQVLEMIRTRTVENEAKAKLDGKKSFADFCVAASYPRPFPKQEEMRAFVIDEDGARLLLGARFYGKTDYTTILGVAYDIYCNPMTSRWLIITKSKERNAAIIDEIAKALIANGVVLEKHNSTCVRVKGIVGKDHSASAATLKSVSLRGRHPTGTIMDDPVTEDDDSEATRKLAEKKYFEIIKLCPKIAIIGQPVHKFDLYAKLRPLLKKLEVPWGTIKELDADLEAQKLAGVSEASISASYHLKVLSEGTVPFDGIKYVDVMPDGDTVAFMDPSNKGEDTTAVTVMRQYFDGVAIVGKVWKKAWNHTLDELVPFLKKHKCKKLFYETNNAGEQPVELLRALFAAESFVCGVAGSFSTTEKHSTIMQAGTFAHLIHLSHESDVAYKNQVIQYEYNADPDDAPDSLARLMEKLGMIRGKALRK